MTGSPPPSMLGMLQGRGPGVVVAFGEAMVRLGTKRGDRMRAATSLSVTVGGTELNVLSALSQLGHSTCWVTALSTDDLAERIERHARTNGVQVRAYRDPGARCPLYFIEQAAPPRAGTIHYDRSDSAMTRLSDGVFDWTTELRDARHLHLTGITLALGPAAGAAAEEAVCIARAAGIGTSFDLNYRSTLWPIDRALEAAYRVLPFVDTLFASPYDLAVLADQEVDDIDSCAARVLQRFGLRTIVCRDSRTDGPLVHVRTTAYQRDFRVLSDVHTAVVIDPVGAGDAATAAYLAVMFQNGDLSAAVESASWACAQKHTMTGDDWICSADELLTLESHGRIRR